jgi:hypothetical protein
VGQFVIVDADPERARALARGPLGFMTAGAGSGYAANLRHMGFAEEEIARVSDRRSTPWWPGASWTRLPHGSESTFALGLTRSH